MPLLSLDDVSIAFSHVPLLDHASLLVEPGERVAVIGRNGTGKSTLLQILSGELAPDTGQVWRQPNTTAARLVQDVTLTAHRTVFDVVADGLGGTICSSPVAIASIRCGARRVSTCRRRRRLIASSAARCCSSPLAGI